MLYVLAGFGVGILGGLFGVGGAEMVIPLLVYVFGFAQHTAQGTSLAMLLPPLGLLAAWRYYQAGHVDVNVALLLAVGFFFGAPLGAMGATALHPDALRRRVRGAAAVDLAPHDLRGAWAVSVSRMPQVHDLAALRLGRGQG